MHDVGVLQSDEGREDLPGEPLHHGEREPSELVLSENVKQGQVEEFEDETNVSLALE
jgi:hypothetical protein